MATTDALIADSDLDGQFAVLRASANAVQYRSDGVPVRIKGRLGVRLEATGSNDSSALARYLRAAFLLNRREEIVPKESTALPGGMRVYHFMQTIGGIDVARSAINIVVDATGEARLISAWVHPDRGISTFSAYVKTATDANVTNCSQVVSQPTYYRLRACNGCGCSDWSYLGPLIRYSYCN